MRAQEFLKELFQPGKEWQWSFTGSEEAVAVFHVGDIPYQFHAYTYTDDPTIWDVEFKNATRGAEQGRTSKFGLTGTGNAAQVMSTVADIMREFLQRYQGKISQLTFTAEEPSRQALYARMAKRLLPSWNVVQDDKSFAIVKPQDVNEDSSGIEYRIYPPSSFRQQTLTRIADLIASGNETNGRNINRNLQNAHAIAFARVDGNPVGVIVVKQPVATYKTKVFAAAGVAELDAKFKLELGYVMINPQYRGQGVAQKLTGLIKGIGEPMYATTRSNNAAMIHILQSIGFAKTGTAYQGESGSELTLWIKP